MKKATETSGKARSKMSSVALGDPSSKRSNPATTSIMIPPDRPAHKPPRATFQKGIRPSLIVVKIRLPIWLFPRVYSFRSFHCRQAIPNCAGHRPRNSARLRAGRMVPIVAKGDAKERRGDTECRENRSSESAGNFGDATAASAMIYRDFQDAGPLLCHQHLHLQIPAVSFLSHGQRLQQVRADRAKRRHIGEVHAIL